MSRIAFARLPDRGSQVIDTGAPLEFQFNGQTYLGYRGDSIASALYASGVRVFSRSFKYHRPRGLLCLNGRCPNCLCNVDGTPNVRICTTALQPGMAVRTQNAWPSVELDALSLLDKLSPVLPVGFYYKTFIQPRALWPVYETVLRHAAGLGVLDVNREPEGAYLQEYWYTDLAVVGGGPAGLAAALEARRLGLEVTLIDDQPALGGHLRLETRRESIGDEPPRAGYERARALAEEVRAAGVELLLGANAFGVYEGGLLGVAQGARMVELRYRALVVATGEQDRPLLFQHNDLPGVMLASGARRLVHLYGVRPGHRVVVASATDAGLRLAEDLLAAGIAVAAVVDARTHLDDGADSIRALRAASVPLLTGHAVTRALGKGRLAGVALSRLDAPRSPSDGTDELQVSCDLLAVATGADPMASLLGQAGCTLRYDEQRDRLVPVALAEGVFAAGQVAGVSGGVAALLLDGRLAGVRAAEYLGVGEPARQAAAEIARARDRRNGAAPATRALVSTAPTPDKTFVCLCEDVTEKDVAAAIAEGFDHIELLKRYTTVTMGPCQGKICHSNAIALTARETGRDRVQTGMTTARPPAQPVELGTLAGLLHEPARLSSIHALHLRSGAEIMDLGEWKRARSYTTPGDEVLAVRERVGIIDVSSLGKLDVRGADAPKLLDKVYANTLSDLKVGRVRYGVVCDDSGIVLDDGTVARLAEDRYFVTTTTSGVTMVQEWFDWWLAGTGLCAHVTNVTSALAAINLAGPRAREVLRQLTDADVSAQAAPYLSAIEAEVAGVPALLLRIGFVGELGYEIHFAAEYGEHLWQALLEAGRDFGIKPFGVEAQRILRLEKGHIIVGQDTDALSNPYEAGMPWIVKLQKPDFIGKPSLQQAKARGECNRLVGFQMEDPALVPEEGSAVEFGGVPVGRVTSARFSPTLRQSIGMAWVPADQTGEGSPLVIRVGGRPSLARVVKLPFYDPEGARMRA